MAGRSGAAAIEMELRDAAKAFCEAVPQLSTALRPTNPRLADGLLAIEGASPSIQRKEDELFLTFAAAEVHNAAALHKIDVSDQFGDIPYGIELHTAEGVVLGVSLYLQ